MEGSRSTPAGPPLDQRAIDALVTYARVARPRAEALIEAAKAVAADEVLEVVTGEATVYGSMTDTRVERLRRIVLRLSEQTKEAAVEVPTAYELATLWRITDSQARTVLRTWRARHPELYEERMAAAVANGTAEPGGGEGDRRTWVISYEDPDVLAYAENRARRSGLSKGLKVDRSALTIEAPQKTKSHANEDLKQVLGVT
jgi:hypothetical protein